MASGSERRKIAVAFGAGFVPGQEAVLGGAVLAAAELGWDVVGIRDGFDGLLWPERYPDGGVVELPVELVERLGAASGALLGTAARTDPFRVRHVGPDHQVEEVDRSDDVLVALGRRGVDGVVAVVGAHGISVAFRLHRKGLGLVCVPKSVENDVAATPLSFGFNSALGHAVDTLDRARQAARAVRRTMVVEVLGERAGWLALQAAVAVGADAALIPEVPYDLARVAARLEEKARAGRHPALVVVAEGAAPARREPAPAASRPDPLRASLSPLATGPEGARAIERAGEVAASVALELQRRSGLEMVPLVLGQLVRGGAPTAVDRQLGMGYGAAAVRALKDGRAGTMVSFQPPDVALVPLAEALNRIRTVPADSAFLRLARDLGIALGD